ncbi:MAG: TIM barrel protein [Chloroflexota bacterium]|nr:TIM barrel protein [Chloroflexota bacterium]
MPDLAASVSWMFNEVALPERFGLASAVGFRAVEIQAPYSESAERLAECIADADLQVALINMPVAVGAIPGEEQVFRDGLAKALSYAEALECGRIHCLAGRTDDAKAETTFIDNVRWAADEAAARGVHLMLEPLNTVDNPGYFLTGSEQARRIIERVGRENVRLQYDIYHMQIMEGRLADSIAAHFDLIGHIQISGVPGRNEPDDQQEINYPFLLSKVDELGYDGWVGCEYRPRAGTLSGLSWARPYGITDDVGRETEGTEP